MATEVKYLSDTLRMIRNCEISPQRAREEVRFLTNLIDARIADHESSKSAPQPEQPAPAPSGDVPEWCVDRIRGLVGIWERDRDACYPHDAIKAVKWLLDKAESEIAHRVAEATKNRDAETQKARRLALEWDDKLTQRDAEIGRLKTELAEATKPVEGMIAGEYVQRDGTLWISSDCAHAAICRERAARLAAEQRLALTREAWRHRYISRYNDRTDHCPRRGEEILTDDDIDAAIAAHEKSKETSNG